MNNKNSLIKKGEYFHVDQFYSKIRERNEVHTLRMVNKETQVKK